MQKNGESVIDGTQDIGKVKKMMQSPIDDSLVVFTGKVLIFVYFTYV